MRKALSLCFGFLCIFILATPSELGKLKPNYYTGNAVEVYTPPTGYLLYEVPGSNKPGTISEQINNTDEFTINIEIKSSNKLDWYSNFPIYAVIVQGNKGFNYYEYKENTLRGDALSSPDGIDNLKYVLVVYKGENSTPSPTPIPTETVSPTQTTMTTIPSASPTPTDSHPVTSDDRIGFIYTGLMLILGSMIFIVVLSIFKNKSEK